MPQQLIGRITIGLLDDGQVALQTEVPSLDVGLMMFERAKLDFYLTSIERLRKRGEQVIETPPPGFDPGRIVTID